jgi:hypothetical protein
LQKACHSGARRKYIYVKVDNRKRLATDVACVFLERNDAAGPYCLRRSTQRGHGIGLMGQDEATNCGVKRRALRLGIVRRDHEVNLPISSRGRTDLRGLDCARFTVERHNAASIAHRLGQKHGYIADAAADFEHTQAPVRYHIPGLIAV